MSRRARNAPGGYVYHVLNRAVARIELFRKEGDYEAFENVIREAHQRVPIRLLSYCVMPNHWHFVLWPEADGELTAFVRWLTHTHAMRWHAHYQTLGSGHLYQSRFKAIPVCEDEHFYSLVRYVERNALRAGLVDCAEAWRWSSLWRRDNAHRAGDLPLAAWPLPCPRDWIAMVNTPQTEAELAAIRKAIRRGQPLGHKQWCQSVSKAMGLEAALRPRGRPPRFPIAQKAQKELRPLFGRVG